jgi:hypothetical protein
VGLVVAMAAALGLTWLSHAPIGSGQPADGTLRLAWRARPERIETCQAQDSEALSALPAHMRQAVICEGENASYRLEVRADRQVIAERIVRPGGLRRDRPLYVLLELPMATGERDIRVELTRIEPPDPTSAAVAHDGTDGAAPADAMTEALRRGELSEALPPSLAYERRLHFAPRQVRLITYDPERRALVEVPTPAE